MTIADEIHEKAIEYMRSTADSPTTIILGIKEYRALLLYVYDRLNLYSSTHEVLNNKFMGMDIILSYEESYLGVGDICKR